MNPATQSPKFLRYNAGQWETLGKNVVVETPVSITVNGEVVITLMCTPTDLEALAVGFLFNEGILKSKNEIALVQVCSQNDNVDVWLNHPIEQPTQWRRTSGCTGGATSVILNQIKPELKDGFVLTTESIDHHIEALADAQTLYREVGGVHSSILCDKENVLASAEDVGRHNSLDKIAGHCLLDSIQSLQRILVTTGRISSEMIQKAARIGASTVISRTSASSLSVIMAQKWGITLIGYARHDHFIVYTHPERIIHSDGVPDIISSKED